MDEEALVKMGNTVYESICKMLDDNELHYTTNDDRLTVSCNIRGDDLPIETLFVVKPQAQIVQMFSPLPLTVPVEYRADTALAVLAVNNILLNGSFDFDYDNGRIIFRICQSYMESILGKEVFKYMLNVTVALTDEYNDRFFMLAKGMMTLDQFLEKLAM